MSQSSSELRSVPLPAKRIVVSVFDLPDMTGQYGETTSGGQTLSRAVTQGGAALLIKSLQDAGERQWFTVLDRSSLDNTLKERQILTEMRRIYRGEDQVDPSALPPLMHASIILEGSITGFDSYVRTGGAGAQYLGIGAATKWQQDTVTVNLRAVSAKTGEVLVSVSVQKAIASFSLQGNVFRYVALDKILEIEAGLTTNEPKQVAVEEAIDKAVYAIIMEGVRSGVWNFADPQAGQVAIADYLDQKYSGEVPTRVTTSPDVETRRPATVVQTVPITLPAKPEPSAAPSPTGLPAPPPADPSEIVG